MLTIKKVNIDGSDEVFQCQYVTRGANSDKVVTIQFHDRDSASPVHVPATSGVVYVMNDLGKTVSTYELGWKEK
jgi:hypothetical protein